MACPVCSERIARRKQESPIPRATVVRGMTILLLLIFSKYAYMASLTNYYTFYLIERFQMSVVEAQVHLFLFLGSVAVGTLLGGYFGDRFSRKTMIQFSVLGALPFTLMLPFVSLAVDRSAHGGDRAHDCVRVSSHRRVRAGTDADARRHGVGNDVWFLVRHRRPGRRVVRAPGGRCTASPSFTSSARSCRCSACWRCGCPT